MIDVSQLTYRFPHGLEALRELSFRVKPGAFVLLEGRSGAGKTVLLDLLSGRRLPDKGELSVLSQDLRRLDPKQMAAFKRRLGLLFQEPRLLDSLTVFENVALPLKLRGLSQVSMSSQVEETLALVNMEDYAKSFPPWLSFYEQQKVALARAIVTEPELLLADDPLSGMDEESGEAFLGLLEGLNQEGLTLLLSTRQRGLSLATKHQLLLLNKGFLIDELERPGSPFREQSQA